MGYDTYFTIRMEGSDEDKAKAIKEFRKLYDTGFFIEHCKTDQEALSTLEDGFQAHWYDYGTDCAAIAKKIPDLLIIVYGDGEGTMDVWECRYKGDLFAKASVEPPRIQDRRLFDEDERMALLPDGHPAAALTDMLTAQRLLMGIVTSTYEAFQPEKKTAGERKVELALIRRDILDTVHHLDMAIQRHERLYSPDKKD